VAYSIVVEIKALDKALKKKRPEKWLNEKWIIMKLENNLFLITVAISFVDQRQVDEPGPPHPEAREQKSGDCTDKTS
jgi:hypothetical protein